ncbi:hypothetical protein ACQR13_20975 [Bradyrhizobium sp. HKCCYLRH3059]|uniref:hypothetical protein n=1 Tax=Bradyrhizobium sp. HKCCYLRH3059 TaxID=3420745 RepID=UPI003EB84381
MVAPVSGHFDDSQSPDDVWTVAGYVGYANQWDFFNELWTDALVRHKVPYFHMKEMASPTGPFAKWLPANEHEEERAAFFKDLVAAIRRAGLYKVSSTVWLKDLERFNEETGAGLEPYPLAAHACLANVALKYDTVPITVVFDRIEKVESKLAVARSYLQGHTIAELGLCDRITATWLPPPATSRDVPALQAADLAAWEVRKAILRMKPWQNARGNDHSDRWSQWQDYVAFTREETGEDPKVRKSLAGLIEGDPGNMISIVWDYIQLMDQHKFRQAAWRKG